MLSLMGDGNLPATEEEILACVDRHFGKSGPGVLLGRGDDCAILEGGKKLCVSSDLFLEDRHFRTSYFEPDDIGYKSLAVNISDLAAMGARPQAFTLALAIPDWASMEWLETFFHGMAEAAGQHGLTLIGGDLARGDRLEIAISVIGEKPDTSLFLLRGGAMAGDTLFLVGAVGLARAGLQELEARGREALKDWPCACRAHLRPTPQIAAALMLGRAGFNARPPALMDVSDGLASDLPRLLAGGNLGAWLEIPHDMLHSEVLRHAEMTGDDPVIEAYIGGEDYALLGACAPDMAQALHSAIPGFRRIGATTPDGSIFCNGKDMGRVSGFDHFS